MIFRPSRFWIKACILSIIAVEFLPFSYSEDADPIIPQKYTAEKYRPVWEKLPFTKPTFENVDNNAFGGNFALLGWSKDIQRRDFVIIFDKQSQQYFHVTKDPEPEQQGLILVSLQKDDEDVSKSSAVVQNQRDGSKATVRFDQSLLNAQPVAQGQPNGEDGQPNGMAPQPPTEQQPSHNIPLRIRRRRINPPPQATP